jgi:hypothetical protein
MVVQDLRFPVTRHMAASPATPLCTSGTKLRGQGHNFRILGVSVWLLVACSGASLLSEIPVPPRRASLLNRAVMFASGSAVTVAILIPVGFIAALGASPKEIYFSVLIVVAGTQFCLALGLFAVEVRISLPSLGFREQLRRGGPSANRPLEKDLMAAGCEHKTDRRRAGAMEEGQIERDRCGRFQFD